MVTGLATGIIVLATLVNAQAARLSPPQISQPPQNKWPETRVYVRKNDVRAFQCRARGNPTPTYAWFKDTNKVLNVKDVISVDKVSGNLTALKYFSPPNSGYYQCLATNSQGASMTPPIYISATDAQPFSYSGVQKTDITAYVPSYLILRCFGIPSSIPPYKVSWKKGKYDRGTLVATRMQMNDRLVVDPKGHLHFLWVDAEEDNEFVYVCAVRNEIIKSEMTNTNVYTLTVTSYNSSLVQDRPLELTYGNNTVEVMAGDDAHLTCIFSYFSKNKQQLDIRWFLRDDEVGQGSTLVIPNVQVPTGSVNQEGRYWCRASLGEQMDSAFVDLKITAPPQFQTGMEPSSAILPVGTDAVFYCNTTSHNSNSDTPIWMVNGNRIVAGVDPYTRFSISSDRARLTLPDVRLTDTMCIQCSVSNNYGVAFGDACLSVIEKIEVLLRPQTTYHVTPGYVLNISVDAKTDPAWQSRLEYRWFWYRHVLDQVTQELSSVKMELPPRDKFGANFMVSQNGKNFTILVPEVEDGDTRARGIYTAMTQGGQIYSVKIGHQHDSVEMNFTITGNEIITQDPTESMTDVDKKPTTTESKEKTTTTGVSAATRLHQNVWALPLYIGIVLIMV